MATDYRQIEQQLATHLGTTRPPIAACVGNRVYTDLADDELDLAIPGRALVPLMAELGTIASANVRLRDYHQQRRRDLATA